MTSTLAFAAVAVSRSIELSILSKATLILALGLVAARAAARSRASVRHLMLAATVATTIALPLLVMWGPAVAVPVAVEPAVRIAPPPRPGAAATSSTAPRANSSASDSRIGSAIDWPMLLRIVWAAGATALFVSLGLALWRVHGIRRRALPRRDLREFVDALAREAGIRRRVDVLEHESVPSPLACGVWRPAIVLPTEARQWTDADLRRAVVHELEHVRRGDWITQIGARAACAVYWLHPLVWTAFRRLCLEAERACDDAVVRGAETTEYADQLVILARRMSHAAPGAILGMANRSDLSARVSALLDDAQRRGRAGAVVVISAVATAALVAVAIAPVRAVATTSPTETAQRRDTANRRVRGIDRALYEAAENGDMAEIDDLLQGGANINSAIDGDGSALIAAARRNRVDVVRHLLDRGADPNMPVPGDGSPLIAAAQRGAIEVVALLLDRGADIDQIVPADENALIQASGTGRLAIVRLLVERGANVNARAWAPEGGARDGEWRTPLAMAQRGRHTDVVQYLISKGAY